MELKIYYTVVLLNSYFISPLYFFERPKGIWQEEDPWKPPHTLQLSISGRGAAWSLPLGGAAVNCRATRSSFPCICHLVPWRLFLLIQCYKSYDVYGVADATMQVDMLGRGLGDPRTRSARSTSALCGLVAAAEAVGNESGSSYSNQDSNLPVLTHWLVGELEIQYNH
jgi:hypothetical protein